MGAIPDWKIRELCDEHDINKRPLLRPFLDYPDQEKIEDSVVSSGLTSHGYDLRLGPEAKLFFRRQGKDNALYPKKINEWDYIVVNPDSDGYFLLAPWAALLAHSVEYFRMPKNIKGQVTGKSTYARMNLFVNTTFIEAGWEGHLTIELVNLSNYWIALKVGEGICQVEFNQVLVPHTSYADKKGKYQGSKGVQIAL